MVIGVTVPRPIDLERPRGLTGRVAQISVDAAELFLECIDRVEGIAAADTRDRRPAHPTARDEQQRQARARLLVADADLPSLIKASATLAPVRLREQRRRSGHCSCRRASL